MTKKVQIRAEYIPIIFGAGDEYANIICERLGVSVRSRDGYIEIEGDSKNVSKAAEAFTALFELQKTDELTRAKTISVLEFIEDNRLNELFEMSAGVITSTARGKQIKCKTLGQRAYIEAIKKNTVVFGIGPAGTGKTFLAVAMAVRAYKNHEVEKIILTRPAIEVGEKLGFLPGDLQQKVDPYLRPLYDALAELFGEELYQKHIERGIIEIAPLAFMRGRTLSSAFIILDEGQNTTIEQMKMFLTRFGEGSKVVVNGDITQIDLPPGKTSGLKHATDLLSGISGVSAVFLTERDVVRHELVQSIIRAYENK